MVDLFFITRKGSDSFSLFLNEIKDKYKNDSVRYIASLIKVMKDFRIYGPEINRYYPKDFPPYKNFSGKKYNGLCELRTKKHRYFLYHEYENRYIGLHGYEKQSNATPIKEIEKALGEIKRWKNTK